MDIWRFAVVEAKPGSSIGSGQMATRSVLIVSNEDFNQTMSNVTALPLTSTKRRLYPAEVFLPAGEAGLPEDAIAMVHQVRTVSKARIGEVYGYLQDKTLQKQVMMALIEYFDINGSSRE
jgi:mRNA interferase MazF